MTGTAEASDEISLFVAPGIRRVETHDLLDEFIAVYGAELSENFLEMNVLRNKALAHSGEKGLTFALVKGREWDHFMAAKGWIKVNPPEEGWESMMGLENQY